MAHDAETHDSDEPVVVRLGLGPPGDLNLLVRVSPHAAAEMRDLMEAHGVFSGEVVEFSVGPELIIYAGSITAGLGGLAAVLRAFFDKNRNKSLKFSRGEVTVEMHGYSEAATSRLLDQSLEELRAKQLERDREWQRITKDEDDGDDPQ